MQNNITYVGNVRIKLKGKPPVRKNNNGTVAFFNVLRDILINAKDLDTANFPYYMSLVRVDQDMSGLDELNFFNTHPKYSDDDYKKLLLHPLLITSKKEIENTSNNETNPYVDGSCVFSALLPHSSTMANSADDYLHIDKIYVLLLDGLKDKTVLAYSKREFKEVKDVFDENSASQAVIEWELSFGNSEKKEY